MQTNNTIVAVSTPAGKGGIGIIRLSGPESLPIARMLFRPLSGKAWQPVPRMLTLGWAYDQDNNALDQVLAVYFAAPKSYTTEDVVEIHAHGAPATLRHIERLCLQYGARLAQAGEFTLRAFMGGRLDLSQAEAVGQLIQARSEQEASLAILNLQGGLGDRLSAIRAALLALSAQVEAWIDFPEEQDEVDVAAFLSDIEAALVQPVEKLLHERQRGRILREGALLILCGRPNVGKSSLFNALLGREKALVSPHPGTTRDGLQDEAVIQGIVCRLQDTAGLGDEAAEAGSVGLELAQMGQQATRQALREADLLLIVLDSSVPLSEEDKEVLRITETYQRLLLASKTDLPAAWSLADFDGIIPVSVRKGDLCNLEKEIAHALFKDAGETAYGRIVVSARQAHQLQDIADTLARTKDLLSLDGAVSWEFVAWELQQCLFSLATLDGQGAPDEVLEEIFSTFCLGK